MLHRLLCFCLLFAFSATTLGCKEDNEEGDQGTADGGSTKTCGKGLKLYKSACVPALDTCKDGEVPLIGGGCLAVGVVECTEGLKLPGAASCTRVGQPKTCPSGWSKVKGGWCEPAYATTKCAAGYKPVLGKSTCQQIRDCGSGTWGNIQATAKTLYVDPNAGGPIATGSQATPYTSINQALAKSWDGYHIALAAGTYNEDVNMNNKVTIEGRCPQMVTIKKASTTSYGTVDIFANGAVLKGVTVTGASTGIVIDRDVSATVEDVVVSGCPHSGILMFRRSALTLKNSLLQGNREFGFAQNGGKADISNTAILDSLPVLSSGKKGRGISATATSATDAPPEIKITDSLIRGNSGIGIQIRSMKATVTRTVVADTKPEPDKSGGFGIFAEQFSTAKKSTSLILSDVLVASSRSAGIYIQGTQVTADRLVVRDTTSSAKDGLNGQGVRITTGFILKNPSQLQLKDSVLSGNQSSGLLVISSDCDVERTLIMDTKPLAKGNVGGFGIATNMGFTPWSTRGSKVTVKDSILARNSDLGLNMSSARVTLERVLVKDTKGGTGIYPAGKMELGYGMSAYSAKEYAWKAETTITDSVFKKNHATGIKIGGSKATLTRTVIQDTQPGLDSKNVGYGLQVIHGVDKTPAEVTLDRCALQSNHAVGALVVGSKLSLKGTVIRNTKIRINKKDYGYGLMLMSPYDFTQASSLKMEDSMLIGNRETGLVVQSSGAVIDRSVIADTAKQETTGIFGDGIQVFPKESKLTLTSSLVTKSARAGILFDGAGGSVKGCTIASGQFSIALESGASPTLGDDNLYDGNKRNPVAFSMGLKTAPLPTVPKY